MGKDLAERVQNGGELKPRESRTLVDLIGDMREQFALAMPRGGEAAQLVRDAITAVRTTKNLDRCSAPTVLGALMTCAQLGLRPNVSGLGHAWVLPYWSGKNRQYEARLIIGYQGYVELAYRTGTVASIVARAVREGDQFEFNYGLAETLRHKPSIMADRGKTIAYYAIVKFNGGGHIFGVMSRAEIEAHRDRFASAKTKTGEIVGPWATDFDAMATKTCLRDLAKYMPKSTEFANAIAADNSVRVDVSPQANPAEVSQVERDEPSIDVPVEPSGDVEPSEPEVERDDG